MKFLYWKNWFLALELQRLLDNAIIQPHFDDACSIWYPNLTQKLKNKPQIMQNKCICFCLKLEKMSIIFHKEFEDLNWLPVSTRFEKCVISVAFNIIKDNYLYYVNKVLEFVPEGNIMLLQNNIFGLLTGQENV